MPRRKTQPAPRRGAAQIAGGYHETSRPGKARNPKLKGSMAKRHGMSRARTASSAKGVGAGGRVPAAVRNTNRRGR